MSALAEAKGFAGGPCLLANADKVPPDIAYKQRGSRCEGVYAVPVSGEIAISVIGFHLGEPAFRVDAPAAVPVRIKGQTSPQSNLAIRIMARDPRLQYQMDTTQVDPTGIYRWDTTMVRDPRIKLGPDEIAAIACDNGCRHDNTTHFFPVMVGAKHASDAFLFIRSTTPIAKLFLTVVNGGKKIVSRKQVSADIIGAVTIVQSLQGYVKAGDNIVTLIGESPDEPTVSWWGHLVMPGP